MASVVRVAFGWLILCRPYATDRLGQLRVWQLFRARGQTASQSGPGPTTARHPRQPEASISIPTKKSQSEASTALIGILINLSYMFSGS